MTLEPDSEEAEGREPEDRKRLHALIEEIAVRFTNEETDESARGVPVGWLLVVEVMDPSGERWLTKWTGDATGADRLPRWTVTGYAHAVLHEWSDEDE